MILSKKVCVQYLSYLLEFVHRYHTRTACDCFFMRLFIKQVTPLGLKPKTCRTGI